MPERLRETASGQIEEQVRRQEVDPVVFHRPQRFPLRPRLELLSEYLARPGDVPGGHQKDHVGIAQQQLFIAERPARRSAGRHDVPAAEQRRHAGRVGAVGFGADADADVDRRKCRGGEPPGLRAQCIHLAGDRVGAGAGAVQAAEQFKNLPEIPVVAVVDAGRRNIQLCQRPAQLTVAGQLVVQQHEIGTVHHDFFGAHGVVRAELRQAAGGLGQGVPRRDRRNRNGGSPRRIPDLHQRTVADHGRAGALGQQHFRAVVLAEFQGVFILRNDAGLRRAAEQRGNQQRQKRRRAESGIPSHLVNSLPG